MKRQPNAEQKLRRLIRHEIKKNLNEQVISDNDINQIVRELFDAIDSFIGDYLTDVFDGYDTSWENIDDDTRQKLFTRLKKELSKLE